MSKPSILGEVQNVRAKGFDVLEANIGSTVLAIQGTTVRLVCYVIGMPVPTIEWKKQGQTVRTPDANVLILEDVKLEDSGEYSCMASNVIGTDQKTTTLTVKGKKSNIITTRRQIMKLASPNRSFSRAKW